MERFQSTWCNNHRWLRCGYRGLCFLEMALLHLYSATAISLSPRKWKHYDKSRLEVLWLLLCVLTQKWTENKKDKSGKAYPDKLSVWIFRCFKRCIVIIGNIISGILYVRTMNKIKNDAQTPFRRLFLDYRLKYCKGLHTLESSSSSSSPSDSFIQWKLCENTLSGV